MFTPVVLRRVSQVVIITFTSLTLQPLQAAVIAKRQHKAVVVVPSQSMTTPQAPAPQGKEEQYGKLLDDIKATAQKANALQASVKGKSGDIHNETQALRDYARQLELMETEVEAGFSATEQHIKDHKLPAVILARHQTAVNEYKARQAEFITRLKVLEDADDKNDDKGRASAMNDLATWLEQNQKTKPHPKLDPNKLPFGTSDGKIRPPKKTAREYQATLFKPSPIHLAGPIPNGFTLPATTLPATPTAADLAETEDIALTPAIKSLAASLNNNPVQINNWVRNNIEYIPTYGSIQGADMTLQTKRGNDMDTASLLIALLRAANIPARYVYGTIQIPSDRAMNWVGSVTKPEAAQQLMGQGGIPNIGIYGGGVIKAIQLEHVWVEAYVDYTPSRGAINKNPDTWVVMDPSYKQYTYTQGMNIQANVPFDAQGLVTQAQTGATIDPTGWVQNINASAVQAALTTYQTQVQDYVSTVNPNATVGDVIGTKTIIPENQPILMGSLPYTVIAEGGKFSALPAMVRHTISLSLYPDAMSKAMGMASLTISQSLPRLAGKKVALVYQPATSADQAVIAAAAASNQPIPAYLVQVMPLLKIEGIAYASGPAVAMGASQLFTVNVTTPWYSHDRDYSITSGDLSVLGINPAGITPDFFKSRIAQHNLSAGTDPDFTAEIYNQIILGYWGENYQYNRVISRVKNIVANQLPSHGLAATPLSVSYFFGIPRSATYKTRSMDIQEDYLAAAHAANDPELLRRYMLTHGQVASYLEGGVYDQAFSVQPFAVQPVISMSSVTILKAANDMGIPIYTIDQTNAATAVPQLTVSPDAIADIQNALAAGKRVTVPQRNITVGTFSGTGYIVEDVTTGAGAYMISGGRNGGSSPAPSSSSPPNQPPQVLLLGSVMTALGAEAGAAASAEFLAAFGFLASPVGLVALAIVVILIVLIYSWIMLMEDFRDEVINRAAANPIVKAQQLPPDNCTLSQRPTSNPLFTMPGWTRCTYICVRAGSQRIPRHLPMEVGCPQPVPCAPGLLWPTGPRTPGVTPIDPSVATCIFLL